MVSGVAGDGAVAHGYCPPNRDAAALSSEDKAKSAIAADGAVADDHCPVSKDAAAGAAETVIAIARFSGIIV